MEQLITAIHSWGDVGRASVLVTVSALLVLAVLFLLGALYRSRDEQLDDPVSLVNGATEGVIIFAKSHLQRTVHQGRFARVEFRWQEEGKVHRLLSKPLKINVYERDTPYIHGPTGENPAQICVEDGIFDRIAQSRFTSAGKWRTAGIPVSIRLKYPSMFNIAYLLSDHPDVSVRATAWVFVLTSGFSVVQTLLMWALGY
jgi:hypothetical protein